MGPPVLNRATPMSGSRHNRLTNLGVSPNLAPMFRFVLALFATLACFAPAASLASVSPAPPVRELSLEDCIRMALARNFDVQIQRFNPQISRFNLEASRGSYDPNWTFSGTERFSKSDVQIDPEFNVAIGGAETTTESGQSTISGVIPTGLNYSLFSSANRRSGNRFRGSQYDSTLGIQLTQPLLRNLWIDAPRLAIRTGRLDLDISKHRLKDTIIRTVTLVENAYYDLIFAVRNVEVQQKSLSLAEQLLEDNRKRVKVGSMAPLEEKQAESQVAARRADLISAIQSLATQQNTLKNLLTDDYIAWSDIEIKPRETLIAVEAPFDKQASWRKGIASRPDLLILKDQLERENINVRYRHNQLFPSLDLTASYNQVGLDSNPGDTIGEALAGNNPNYSIGARVTIPLGNRAARNRYQASKIAKMQAILRVKQTEQNVLVEIDNAIRNAESTYRRVEATRDAREYAEAALAAEEKKLANGASTSFVVLQMQRDVTNARSSEIRAIADYNKALASVASSEASTLERKNIELDFE
jgi:outer membrane protein TolC